jgi:hypothetical protein
MVGGEGGNRRIEPGRHRLARRVQDRGQPVPREIDIGQLVAGFAPE